MTIVLNDPSWWPAIYSFRFYSYFVVSCSVMMIYDCVLTLGQEIELIWRQRWSLMTVLYLSIRYIGTLFVAMMILNTPSVSVSDAGCNIMIYAMNWAAVGATAMLGVIMIARLHAMYHGSRRMLTFLIVIFLVVNIACIVITVMTLRNVSAVELILSGTYHVCGIDYEGNSALLLAMIWMLNTVWEVLALSLSLWIAVKHFLDLRRLGPSTGSIIKDMFTVLIQSHVLYFASFASVSCLQLGTLSPAVSNSYSVGSGIYQGVTEISSVMQMFVLGPRLILSVREYNAKLVANSDAGTHMTSIAFQERVHVSTSSTV